MAEYLKIIIPAGVALAGTLITVLVGYRQWKRQRDDARYATFLKDKEEVYKRLWEQLEEVQIKLRTENVSDPAFNALVKMVNSYILKNSLYLEEQDKSLSNRYLDAVRKTTEIIIRSKNERAEEAMVTTREIPDEVVQAGRELNAALKEMKDTRDLIIYRFRDIISGKRSA